jgi:exodeoxyribonuclease V gamma subunit
LLILHTANRYEELRDRLLVNFAATPVGDPFGSRQIIVPSMAVKRDLQLAITRHQGVCARVEFPFLAQWLWDSFAQFVEVPAVSPFAPQRLTWRLFKIFADTDFVAEHPRLQQFLGQADDVMRFELAQRVAGLFEQIVTYRPEWLADWREGRRAHLPPNAARQDEDWQAALWRRVTDELGTSRRHPATAFLAALASQTSGQLLEKLPASVVLFGLPTLPPQYLNVLLALSAHIDIALYQINPCAEFWFDIVDKKRLTRLQANGNADFHETGNPLLAAWGKQTQSLFALLFESDAVIESSADFVEHPDTLLGTTQNAILHLQNVPADFEIAAGDRSLEIHVCHSLTRELEVLHDRLLALHATQPDLRADQILVAVPDLEAAGPLIEAVFAARGSLPFHITGRAASTNNPVARCALAVLDAAMSRLPASEGIALLREPLIAHRFRLDENDVETLIDALREAGLHWGLDAHQRSREGLPEDYRHTWRDALGRLLLGVAVGHDDTTVPFQGILPVGQLSGSKAHVLGQLWLFLEALENLRQRLSRPLLHSEWLDVWLAALDSFQAPQEESLEAMQQVRTIMADLVAEMSEGQADNFTAPVARAALAEALDSAQRGGIPGGAITFAALPSLRSLPYRVVCLLGLNDGVFPSVQRPLEFDLLASDYRLGDRQRRLDDRNLFLDLFLSARETLHLSYTGRSQHDDSPMPPSVLLAELLDHLRPVLGDQGVASLVVHHPLQAFSFRYRDALADPRLMTFETTLKSTTIQPLAFFGRPLPSPEADDDNAISLTDLHAFFRHPARAVLRDQLGIKLADTADEICDEEPLLMDQPDTWPLQDRLLQTALNGASESELLALALAGAEVPSGAVGLAQIKPMMSDLKTFAQAVSLRLQTACLPLVQSHLLFPIEAITVGLNCTFRNLRTDGLLRYRYAPLSAGDLIAAWLDHLALCAMAPKGVSLHTEHLGRGERAVFGSVDNPQALLSDWVAAYWQGLQMPLVFPPKTAWALKSQGESAAQTAWHNAFQSRGEALDVWWQLALRGKIDNHNLFGSVLFSEMEALSDLLLGPLLAHLESNDG